MKYNSMKTAPKGRMPPMTIVKSKLRYHAWLGMTRGTMLVLTGGSASSFRYPNQTPTHTRGNEMRNQMHSSANMVPNGTAPDDACPQMKKLSTKKIMKVMPGYRKAVSSVSAFHWEPLKAL